MLEGLSEFMAAETPAGDTSTETPETPVVEAAAPSEVTEQPAPADTASATGTEDDWGFDPAEFDQANPQLAPLRKQLQATFTRKAMELAEQRKAIEGIDPNDLQFLRHLNQTLQYQGPQAAAALIDQVKQQWMPPADPESQEPELEYATETERILHQKLQQMEAWQQQQVEARNQAEIEKTFTELGREFGQEIPLEQRRAAAQICLNNGWDHRALGMAWRAQFGVEAAKRAGRSEGASVVSQKAALTAPPSALTPPASAPAWTPENAGSLREVFEKSRMPG